MDNTKKNNRRISIVLNGKEKSYEDLQKQRDSYEEVLNQEISATKEEQDEFPWVLPETLKDNPKNVIDMDARRRDKKKLGAPFWDDGKSDESPKIPVVKRKKKREFSINIKALPLGVLGIIFSAIIVGLSFGFMMKTIFTGEKIEQAPAAIPVMAQASNEATVTDGIQLQVPTLVLEVVQGGAFSLLAKGRETAQAIKENGFAATLSNTTDPVYLFIGVGLDKDQATVIANKYKENGQDVYVKPYAVTSAAMVETEAEALFLQTGVELVEKITLLSVNGFANGGTLITDETVASLTQLEGKFATVSDAFAKNETKQLLAIAFQDSLKNASQQLQNYATTKDEARLWQVQQHLLTSVITYEELLKTF